MKERTMCNTVKSKLSATAERARCDKVSIIFWETPLFANRLGLMK